MLNFQIPTHNTQATGKLPNTAVASLKFKWNKIKCRPDLTVRASTTLLLPHYHLIPTFLASLNWNTASFLRAAALSPPPFELTTLGGLDFPSSLEDSVILSHPGTSTYSQYVNSNIKI